MPRARTSRKQWRLWYEQQLDHDERGCAAVDTTGANGDQFISEVSGLSGFNLNAKEGNITLTAGGAILDSDNDVDVTANIANLTVTGGSVKT